MRGERREKREKDIEREQNREREREGGSEREEGGRESNTCWMKCHLNACVSSYTSPKILAIHGQRLRTMLSTNPLLEDPQPTKSFSSTLLLLTIVVLIL